MFADNVVWKTDHGGYPFLSVDLDGKNARLYADTKPDFLEMGVIILPPFDEWKQPEPVYLPEKRDEEGEIITNDVTLEYGYRSPKLAELVLELQQAVNADEFEDGRAIDFEGDV